MDFHFNCNEFINLKIFENDVINRSKHDFGQGQQGLGRKFSKAPETDEKTHEKALMK
jgi:hypothetical protein